MSRKSLLLLAGCAALAACQSVVSVNPMIPDAARVTEPRLAGAWVSNDSDSVTVTSRGLDYHFFYVSKGEHSEYRAHLARTAGRLLMDVAPQSQDISNLMVPGHALFVLEVGAENMRLWIPRADSIAHALLAGRLRLPYIELPSHDIVLTGSTAELFATLPKWLDRVGVYDDVSTWRRVASK